MGTLPNFEIVHSDGEVIRIVDRGPWDRFPTVTNRVEEVIDELIDREILSPGMRLFYYDSEGEFARILLSDDLRFAGFAPAD